MANKIEKKPSQFPKRKGKKTLTKRIYTGGIFAGPGKITKRKKKLESDLRVKYRKDKKAIKESPDWDKTNDEKLDKLLDKYMDDKKRIEDQSWKDRDLIEDYGLRGATARSFMTERGEKYPYPDLDKIGKSKPRKKTEIISTIKHGGKVVNRKKGKSVGGSKTPTKKIKPNVGMSATFPLKIDIGVTAKKHGGKITYKMTGGQVVDAGYE